MKMFFHLPQLLLGMFLYRKRGRGTAMWPVDLMAVFFRGWVTLVAQPQRSVAVSLALTAEASLHGPAELCHGCFPGTVIRVMPLRKENRNVVGTELTREKQGEA